MTRTIETASVAVLNRLNQTVEDVERDVQERTKFLEAVKSARDTVASAMLNGGGNTTTHRRRHDTSKSNATRTAMLKTILANAPSPVTVAQIATELHKHGRSDERAGISQTLSYLKRIGIAKNVERGRWISVTGEEKQAA